MSLRSGGADIDTVVLLLNSLSTDPTRDDWQKLVALVQSSTSFLDARSDMGESALHLAAEHLKPDYCGLLLARGAGANVGEHFDSGTPLHSTVQPRLEGDLTGPRPDGIAAREADVVRVLVAGGADPDALDRSGETALMQACRFGREGVVRGLLAARGMRRGWERGKEVLVNQWSSPLMLAVAHGHLGIVRALCAPDVRPRMVQVSTKMSLRSVARSMDFFDIETELQDYQFSIVDPHANRIAAVV